MESGTQLGSYEILSQLGKGGMGEVWRARDSKLGREVAIKTLPEEFARDEERLARFEREAKLLASLNHPNIAAIHGFEQSDDTHFLVLELVEGDTLAEKIRRGALPVEEALEIAKQTVEALEAAHEKGVIHRDLKPANIKVTPEGQVKVLDFGLAKALSGDEADPSLSNSPTLSMQATQQGVILGTAAYMSPEQAKGIPVDRRTDIFSFGCVLFEMLTGRQTFQGTLASEILAQVLERGPDFSMVPPNIHPRIHELLRRCLEKQPKQRWQAVGDLRVEIEHVLDDPRGTQIQSAVTVEPRPRWRALLPWAMGGLLGILIGVVDWNFNWRVGPPREPIVTRFPVTLPGSDRITGNGGIALSPNGDRLVYAATRDGVRQLFVRARDRVEAVPIRDTEGASHPFLSPDGDWVGFFTGTELKKVSLSGGPAQPLCPANGRYNGATWGPDNSIVFSEADSPGLMQVSASGGEPRPLTTPEGGASHRWPEFLLGGEAVLFTITRSDLDDAQVAVLSLTTGDHDVLANGADAHFAASGHLVFAREASLWAAPFDIGRLQLTGDPAPIVENVQVNPGGWAHYSLANDGSVAYLQASGAAVNDRKLALADRDGRMETLNVPTLEYLSPRLSPNGDQMAVETNDEDGGSSVWIYGLSGETAIQRLPLEGNNSRPIWSPDGEWLAFASDRDGSTSIYRQRVDGSGIERLTTPEEGTTHYPESWSPEDTISFVSLRDGDRDIWTLSLDSGAGPEAFAAEPVSQQMGSAFSRDGKWIAYSSSPRAAAAESELYVQPFPPTGDEYEITRDTGVFPVWSPDGSELFYRPTGTINTLKMVGISTEPAVRFRGEQVLPIRDFIVTGSYRDYDITPDGEKFIVVMPALQEGSEAPNTYHINVVLNWFEELKERVPVP